LKFTVDTPGQVTGVRFYKASANTGSHVGALWSASGVLLAQATFSGESGSGWQQVSFSSPVAVSPGVTYVVSYLAPVGHYSAAGGAFTSAGVSSPPVYALGSPTSANGVYAYGSSLTFPTSSYNSTNYYVDVLYSGTGS
jgi:hypothetical protein